MNLTITEDRTIPLGQTLTINMASDERAGTILSGSMGNHPSLYVYGSLIINSTEEDASIQGIWIDSSAWYEQGTIENHGLIQLSAASTSMATGVGSGGFIPYFNNSATGRLVVSGGGAIGVLSYDPAIPINNSGVIQATATNAEGDAIGINLYNINHAPYTNSGTLSVHGIDGYNQIVGVYGWDSGFEVDNSGVISVTADLHAEYTIGVLVRWPDSPRPSIVENSGSISAGWGVYEDASTNSPSSATTFVNNSGSINGNITLGIGRDTLLNTGTIIGEVDLGAGEDTYDGRGGHIDGVVYGWTGNDQMLAGGLGDTLSGEAGDDTLASGAGNDVLDGGDGIDMVDYQYAAGGVSVSLDISGSQDIGGGQGTDTLVAVENLSGSDFDDRLTGNGAANVLIGAGGQDTLDGGAGNDALYGDWPAGAYLTRLDLVSSNGIGTVGNDRSSAADFSPDGGKVMFMSRASNLATQTAESYAIPVYLKDLMTGDVRYLEFAPVPGTIDTSATPLFSPDGTKAALGQYLMDLESGHVIVAATAADGSAANGICNITAISPDATRIVFTSTATNLVAGDANGATNDVFLKDLVTGTVSLVSTSSEGQQGNFTSDTGVLSPDGTKVLFDSMATNLGPGPSNIGGIFLKDLQTGQLTEVSACGWDGALSYRFTPDGSHVLFETWASGVVPGTNGWCQIYLYDISERSTVCLSTAQDGSIANAGCFNATMSPDGHYLAFTSTATNLTASLEDPSLYYSTIFVKDLVTGSVQPVYLPTGLRVLDQSMTGMHYSMEASSFAFSPDGTQLLLQAGLPGSYEQDIYIANFSPRGEGGDDTLTGGTGNDTINGGAGYDKAVFGGNSSAYTVTYNPDGSTTVTGADGTDTLWNIEEIDFSDTTIAVGSITGTADSDTLTGTAYNDTFDLTQGGNDTALGLGGNDLFRMGAAFNAADQLDGGPGLDTVQLDGEYTGGNALTMNATTMVGIETLVLAAGHNYTITSAAATVAAGESLTVNASALGAANVLNFNGAVETDGSFVFIGGAGNDVLRGGAGSDTVDYSGAASGVTVNLTITIAQGIGGGMGSDTLNGIENLIGSGYADTLIGDGGNNTLNGGGGADSLRPGMGTDTVSGGNGDDSISFTGGRFDASDAIDGGAGNDLLWLTGDYSGGVVMNATTLTNVENIAVSSGFNYSVTTADATVAAGKALSVDATGLGVSNTLYFDGSAETDGSFTLLTGAGADTLVGGGGGDTFRSGGGFDHVSGNGGNDTISFSLGHLDAADVIDGGAGTDMAWLNSDYTGANAVVFNATTLTNVETIALSASYSFSLTTADATVGAGKQMTVDGSSLGASKTLSFNGSAETDGSFVVIGGAGVDTLIGGNGADTLSGRAGNDTLRPGWGSDVAFGGDGDDTISFTGGKLSATDIIDGGTGTDIVWLNGDYAGANAVSFNATTMSNVESIGFAAGFNYSLTSNNATVASGKTLTLDASSLGAANALTFDGSAETNGAFTFVSGSGADNLRGGSGADTFKYDAANRSTGLHYDTINALNFANDSFDITGAITAIDAAKTTGSLSTASFDSDLTSRMFYLGANHAMLFTPNAGTLSGQTFLVIDCNGTAGYQAGQDLVIRLNGYSGTLTTGAFH